MEKNLGSQARKAVKTGEERIVDLVSDRDSFLSRSFSERRDEALRVARWLPFRIREREVNERELGLAVLSLRVLVRHRHVQFCRICTVLVIETLLSIVHRARYRLPHGISVFLNVHLGETTNVPDTFHFHSEVPIEVNNIERSLSHTKTEDVRCQKRRNEFLKKVHRSVLKQLGDLRPGVLSMSVASPAVWSVVCMCEHCCQKRFRTPNQILVWDEGS